METEYEFTDSQNIVIGQAAKNVRFVGIASIALGAFLCLSIFVGSPYSILLHGAIYITLGVMTRGIGISLQAIVDLEGSDISHLMRAMKVLSDVYGYIKWLILLLIGSGFLVFLMK